MELGFSMNTGRLSVAICVSFFSKVAVKLDNLHVKIANVFLRRIAVMEGMTVGMVQMSLDVQKVSLVLSEST